MRYLSNIIIKAPNVTLRDVIIVVSA